MDKESKRTEFTQKVINKEKEILQLKQKALDKESQLTIKEIEMLKKENTKKIVDRILFALGLICATLLICAVVWPNFRIFRSFFSFKYPKEVLYDMGYIDIADNEIKRDVADIDIYLLEVEKVSKENLNEHEIEIVNSIMEYIERINLIKEDEIEEFNSLGHVEKMGVVSEKLLKLRTTKLEEASFVANWLPFYAGYNPNDVGLSFLYVLNGIVFLIVLIVLIVTYVIVMAYGIRYFIQLFKGIIVGASMIGKEALLNVASSVVEDGAERSFDDITNKIKNPVKKTTTSSKKSSKSSKQSTQRRKVNKSSISDVITNESVENVSEQQPVNETVETYEEIILDDNMDEEKLNQILSGSITFDGREKLFDDEDK